MTTVAVCLLAVLAVVSLAGSAVVPASDVQNAVKYGDKTDAPLYLDGVNVNLLTVEELLALADEDDLRVQSDLDILAGARAVAVRRETTRPKRWIPLAARALWTAGRALFGSSARGALSRSGSRLTRQYQNPGNYGDAVRHFRNLRPQNVKPIGNNKGLTGKVGRHQVTVRDTSSSGRPTLEIRSPTSRSGASTYVRKFRFQQ